MSCTILRRLELFTIVAGSSLFLTGCGSDKLDVYPAQGLLLLDDEPFGPTGIQLVPIGEGGRSVAGHVDEQGKVTFTSYDQGDGAPKGEYRCIVGVTMQVPPRPFPSIYRDMEKSPLKVTVNAGDKNELVLAMDSKAGRPIDLKQFDVMSQAQRSEGFKAGVE